MKNNPLVILFALAVFFAGCTAQSKENNNNTAINGDIQTIPVTQLIQQQAPLERQYVGDIKAQRNVEIYSRIKGYLEEIYVDEGEDVQKGQLLFRINNDEYKVELARAKANLQNAIAEAKAGELEVSRIRQLVEKKVISVTELDVAMARFAALKAKISEAETAESQASIRLTQTNIKAPFDGIIDRIPYKVGSLINEGTLLTTVSDTRYVHVYFKVSESEYLEYVKTRKKGDEKAESNLELFLADGSKFAQKGRIETMEGEFDEGTGSIAFRAKFSNPEKILKHGSTGTIRLTNVLDDAVLVPQKSVFEIQDKNYVYVIDQKNQVKMRSFVPKSRFSNFYVVDSGLEPGERIVYEGGDIPSKTAQASILR